MDEKEPNGNTTEAGQTANFLPLDGSSVAGSLGVMYPDVRDSRDVWTFSLAAPGLVSLTAMAGDGLVLERIKLGRNLDNPLAK